MCGGSPLMMASVTKILRKSCCEKIQRFTVDTGEFCRGECVDEQLADCRWRVGPVFVADGALE